MYKELIERLRNWRCKCCLYPALYEEAADALEAADKRIAALEKVHDASRDLVYGIDLFQWIDMTGVKRELKVLREALKEQVDG